jgi:hypothetical protein
MPGVFSLFHIVFLKIAQPENTISAEGGKNFLDFRGIYPASFF